MISDRINNLEELKEFLGTLAEEDSELLIQSGILMSQFPLRIEEITTIGRIKKNEDFS